jgi:hypothetical protein
VPSFIHIADGADDALAAIMKALCELSLAVNLSLRDGSVRGVVLISASDTVVFCEEWDEQKGTPAGTLLAIPISDIERLRID